LRAAEAHEEARYDGDPWVALSLSVARGDSMARARTLINVWLTLAAAIAGCQDPVYANHEYVELDGDKRSSGGGVCIPVGDWRSGEGGGSIGDAQGDIRFDHALEDDTLIVDVSSQGRQLEHREYSEKRLRSGERDQFTVETAAGRSYEITYWGSDDCWIH
jgi:hypothetical protein